MVYLLLAQLNVPIYVNLFTWCRTKWWIIDIKKSSRIRRRLTKWRNVIICGIYCVQSKICTYCCRLTIIRLYIAVDRIVHLEDRFWLIFKEINLFLCGKKANFYIRHVLLKSFIWNACVVIRRILTLWYCERYIFCNITAV
jgi:hypothetical protein